MLTFCHVQVITKKSIIGEVKRIIGDLKSIVGIIYGNKRIARAATFG